MKSTYDAASHISFPVGITPAKPGNGNTSSMATEHLHNQMQPPRFNNPVVDRATMWAETMRNTKDPSPATFNMTSCKAVFNTIITSKLLVSAFVFLFMVALLLIVNPPIVQKRGENGLLYGRSPVKIIVWSLVTALLALCIPCLGYTPFKTPIKI